MNKETLRNAWKTRGYTESEIEAMLKRQKEIEEQKAKPKVYPTPAETRNPNLTRWTLETVTPNTLGYEIRCDGQLIGIMIPAVAERVVELHNSSLSKRKAS